MHLNLDLSEGFYGAILSSSRSEYAEIASRSVPIYWSEVECRGDELSLSECPHSTSQATFCSHYEDAGVLCAGVDNIYICMYIQCTLYHRILPFILPLISAYYMVQW